MAGLQKIIDRIIAEAHEQADAIVADANREAEQILSAAGKESERVTDEIRKKSAADVENYKKRIQSANDLYFRTENLKSKQALIARVIDQAYEKVCGMDAPDYFAMLEKMIEKYALAQDGEICFSAKDLQAMPADYKERIKAAAAKAGGSLTLAGEGKAIENGFLLIYGGIEENCTIRAIFDARRDEMQDTVHALLYRKEA